MRDERLPWMLIKPGEEPAEARGFSDHNPGARHQGRRVRRGRAGAGAWAASAASLSLFHRIRLSVILVSRESTHVISHFICRLYAFYISWSTIYSWTLQKMIETINPIKINCFSKFSEQKYLLLWTCETWTKQCNKKLWLIFSGECKCNNLCLSQWWLNKNNHKNNPDIHQYTCWMTIPLVNLDTGIDQRW